MDSDAPLCVGGRTLLLRVSAASDTGSVRAVNEDNFLATMPVFLVADGMGGHAHGDLASSAVVKVFEARHAAEAVTTVARVLGSVAAANTAVQKLSDPSAADEAVAGTTVTGVALVDGGAANPPAWMVFNVGDSRVYSWRADGLVQVTVDHSAVQELVDDGTITRAEAEDHPERNVVTRALGVDDRTEAEVWLIPTGGNQLFVICSDGLTKEVSDDRIAELIGARAADDPLADMLVAEALSAGGSDNVTAVVVDVSWIDDLVADRGSSIDRMPAFLEETSPRI